MRKLIQRLTMLILLVITVIAFSWPTGKPVQAATSDCDLIAALCRIASSADYEICLLKGGSPTDCAWAEAEQTIKCIKDAGCGSLPKGPGDN